MSLLENASLVITPNGYKEGKIYAVKPTDGSGDLTVARASTKTRVNPSQLIETIGTNVPSIDYTGGGCPSILVEPQRTNLALRSEEFDNATWAIFNGSVTTNSATSPSGITNADTLTANGVSAVHAIQQNSSLTLNASYVVSFYAKNVTNNFIQLYTSSATGGMYANFNIDNGVVGTLGTTFGSNPTSSITSVGDGWYRCTMVFTSAATAASTFGVAIVSSSSAARLESNSLATAFYIWGAQLEVGSYATSYIPTTTAAVTRVADVVSKTGISSLIGQTEGVLYFEIKCFENGNVNRAISIYENNTLSNGIQIMIHNTPNYIFFQKYINSVRTTNLAISTINQTNNNKIAFRRSSSGIDIFLNGNKILTNSDSANFTGTLNNLYFSESIGSSKFEGKIKQLQLFKTALSDAELTELTTP